MGLDNPIHILFLLILLLLVFGAKRLPEMGRSLGTGLRGFKDTLNGASSHGRDVPQAVQDAPAVQPVPGPAEGPAGPASAARTANGEHPRSVSGAEEGCRRSSGRRPADVRSSSNTPMSSDGQTWP